MKTYCLSLSLDICVLVISLITLMSCSTYSEGDEVATRIFKKMTVQEKTLYDAVEKEWGQSYLINVRKGVQNRDISPRETMMPFKDIAALIKTNNNVTLKINEAGWNTDHKNRAIKCRWDRLDESWYRKLLLSIGVKDYKITKFVPIVDEKEKDVEKIKNDLVVINNYIDEHPEVVKTITEDNSLFVSIEELDELFYKIRGCDEALEYYNEVLIQRLIDYDDHKILIQLATKCKAIQIGQKLFEWRN